jgi:hypothetical protein
MAPKDRERIEPSEGDQRYIRRDDEGHFTDEQVDVGRSISQDMKQKSNTKVKPGQGDRGDINADKRG